MELEIDTRGAMIIRAAWPDAADHKTGMLEAIARQRKQLRGRLGVGGTWAGPKTLGLDIHMAPLMRWLRAGPAQSPGLNDLLMWGLVMERGDEIQAHGHVERIGGPNRVAGVYFLDLPTDAGQFYFEDLALDIMAEPCVEGEAVLFHASIRHGVTAHQIEAPRITIAWSAR